MADKLIDFAVRVMHDYNGLEEKLQNLERNMNVLTYRADDTIKALGEAELHSGRKRKREVEEWLEDVERKKTEFASLKMLAHKARFFARILMARRVDKMIEVIADLVKQSEVFGDFLLDVCETKGMPLVAAEWKGQTFEQDLQEIWAWLMNDEISRIGIYGMGGVGKTTLATRIHNDLLNEATFCGHVYWITASHDASIPKLQNAVAKAINLDISDEDDEKRIAAKLFNALKRRDKFVIIVDDIWSNFDVEKIGIPLGAVGRKLVVTSRSLEVCRRMGCQKEIKVKPLNEEEAWTFFLEKLGCPRELPRDVKEVAKLMARRCHGLPLGIITVAGSMKGVDNIHEWRDALNELQECSLGQDDEVFQILQYSFNCLRDQRLKNCFLYCCLYPEDYKIHGDELIRYFILEGLLDRRSTRQAEFDQGHRILSRLENVCLLESGFGIDGYEETKYVKMHDLIRDMALKVTKTSEPKYMVKAGIELTGIPEENEWKEDLDKVSLMYNELTYVPAAASLNCPKLSTLNLKSNWLTLIPVSFFAQLGAIRVLDLSFNELLEVLPICISNMENLTALLVQCCRRLNFVPPVGKLKALRELDLYETCIENVPEGVGKLVNLKCLDIGNTRVSMIPDGTLSKLSRLQSLKIPKRSRNKSRRTRITEAFGRISRPVLSC
ncbi:hypothetical protein ACH5RR_037858 [Cinchona calisaya]|uniref:AAA+ ATPase domain-containing protein n=1 Tax=Cinchona calisaya TaxID=153742 RepID=A0ABD2YB37_9GENT